jgi:hypothetical protein
VSALRKALLAGAVCAVLAACSSSSSSSSSAPATTAASSAPATAAASSAPASSAPASASASSPAAQTATKKTIAANWTAFFDPKVPAARRVALLEDGPQLAAAISAQAKSSTAAQTSAKVISVTVTSATQAKVVYDILLSGTPALTNQAGTAVLQGGTWKVSAASFCGLLALQSGGSTKSLPAICKSAS